MPDNLKKELQDSIQALYIEGDTRRFSSKTIIVREIYDDIEKARKRGVTLSMFLRVLQGKGFDISYSEFKQILYRIRKERKPESEKVEISRQSNPQNITTPISPPSSAANKNAATLAELTKKMDAFNNAVGWQDRFIALGGNIEDIRGKPASEQRHMAMNLKSTVERELRDHQ